MQVTIVAINRINVQGTSKKGTAYHIDETRLTVSLPFSTDDGFGIKTHEYVVGKSSEFAKYEQLRDKLPVQADITLSTEINQYGQPVTVATDVKLVKTAPNV